MKKTAIVYGSYTGVTVKAVELLTEILLDSTGEYPACISAAEFERKENVRYIFVGTKENNDLISQMSELTFSEAEEYVIRVQDDEVLIEGADEGGMLYGCVDFYCKYVMLQENTHISPGYFRNLFADRLPDFTYRSHPDVKDRGIWTWGHVIYNYKSFIDNMVKCKMNTLIVWDDFVPVNAAEMVRYAHLCNVKVIWGYSWLWDTSFGGITREVIEESIDKIADLYEEKYAHLGGDGIYFQSFTELGTDTLNGMLIAEAVTDFVNRVSGMILDRHPDLEIQFGLHATSVREKLEYISKVDPRVRITWEDCGAFPFHYVPEFPKGFEDFEGTLAFAAKLTNLRTADGVQERFGVVLKGFTCLDWRYFEHQQGRFVLGVSSEQMQEKNVRRKEKIWKYVQAHWLSNADKAFEVIRCMQKSTGGELCITALVEDGMFENRLYFPVALYAEMLWDSQGELKQMMTEVAQRSWVSFA